MNQLNDQVRTEVAINLTFGGWQLDICQAVLAVPELCGYQFLEEWMLRACGYRDVAPVRKRNHPQGVFKALSRSHITRYNRDGANIQFWRVERQHQGHRVIGAGIGIKNDFLRSGRNGDGRGNENKQEKVRQTGCSPTSGADVFQGNFSGVLPERSLASRTK